MAAPFSVTSVSNYNINPPTDDGATTSQNRVDWSKTKVKIGDPLKTAFDASETATLGAFQKMVGGAGVLSTAVDYVILAADQGKLVKVTVAGKTVTTPDATIVGSPFTVVVLNNSSGTVTVAGNNPGVQQNIDGAASISLPAGRGFFLFTDGTNWFTSGQLGIFAGNQMGYGQIINGTIVESNATNAVTFAVKTLAGADPSVTDPVLLAFRNATTATGNYVYRSVTSALSITISSGSTLGAASGVPFKVWLVIFDDAGTIRLGAMNCVSGGASPTAIFNLRRVPVMQTLAEGGAGAADSALVAYTGTAIASSRPFLVFGYAAYESGLATAGSWNVSPTTLQLYGPGVPLPGDTIGLVFSPTGAVATGTTTIPSDDTIPQITEGDEYMSTTIAAISATNLLEIEARAILTNTAGGGVATWMVFALFHDAVANALVAVARSHTSSNLVYEITASHLMLAGTTSVKTIRARAGISAAGTTTFNGGGSGTRLMGGVANSFISIKEIMT